MSITLTPEEVKAEKYKEYCPLRNHFVWNPDGSCTVHPLPYWDDASYASWQGDSYGTEDYGD